MWGEMSFWPAYGTKKPMTGSQVLRRSVFEGVWTGYDAENMVNSHVIVRDNRFVAPAFSGVLLAVMSASSVHVPQNDIELAETGWYGIWMELMEGVLVNQNRIAGSGLGGIYAGSGSRYLILNNNLEDVAVPTGSYPVWLGAATSDSLVVGVDPALVLDEGTNNRIIPGGRGH
jgi:hypothetical protein